MLTHASRALALGEPLVQPAPRASSTSCRTSQRRAQRLKPASWSGYGSPTGVAPRSRRADALDRRLGPARDTRRGGRDRDRARRRRHRALRQRRQRAAADARLRAARAHLVASVFSRPLGWTLRRGRVTMVSRRHGVSLPLKGPRRWSGRRVRSRRCHAQRRQSVGRESRHRRRLRRLHRADWSSCDEARPEAAHRQLSSARAANRVAPGRRERHRGPAGADRPRGPSRNRRPDRSDG